MGGWAVAQSPILVTTITLLRLAKRGYQSLLEYYLKISPQFNEPLITVPLRSRWCEQRSLPAMSAGQPTRLGVVKLFQYFLKI
jgi:hypothetical protein